jgi:hypothetical protein
MSISRWAALAVLPLTTVVAAAAPASAASSTSLTKAQALVASAISTTSAVKSVKVVGSGSSAGKTVKINLTVGPNAAFGTLIYSGQTTTLRRVGTAIYAKGTQGFLEQQGMSASQAKVEANKWFSIPTSDASDYQNLDQFLTVSGLLAGLVPSAKGDKVTASKLSTLRGQKVDVVTGTFSGQKGSVYVATHGKPYLLRVVQLKGASGGGTIDLSDYNQPVKTTTPKGAVTQ